MTKTETTDSPAAVARKAENRRVNGSSRTITLDQVALDKLKTSGFVLPDGESEMVVVDRSLFEDTIESMRGVWETYGRRYLMPITSIEIDRPTGGI